MHINRGKKTLRRFEFLSTSNKKNDVTNVSQPYNVEKVKACRALGHHPVETALNSSGTFWTTSCSICGYVESYSTSD